MKTHISIKASVRVRCEHPKLVKKLRHRWNYPFGRKNKAVMTGLKSVDYVCSFCGVRVRRERF